jgi:polyisoprenoid-binding protein YceI
VGHYLLNKDASRFTVRAFAGGMLSALGQNPTIAIRDFTGEATFAPDAPGQASLRIQIQADSLEVMDEKHDEAEGARKLEVPDDRL